MLRQALLRCSLEHYRAAALVIWEKKYVAACLSGALSQITRTVKAILPKNNDNNEKNLLSGSLLMRPSFLSSNFLFSSVGVKPAGGSTVPVHPGDPD